MSKNVQIPIELFYNLCLYHGVISPEKPLEVWEEEELSEEIGDKLGQKLDAIMRHEMYSKYKDLSLSVAERQAARKEYLNMVGMREGYRWESLEPPL